ncbi:T9SS type A sorting domain-containing protein [Pseudopedobacter beijingensis]|uniref:T9SS type A sorting domain-containing protein n=1 Tax=Pseudopedobacter beijingensis TaxID=1207056 RepID=A0ABW4IEP6_9SPHI
MKKSLLLSMITLLLSPLAVFPQSTPNVQALPFTMGNVSGTTLPSSIVSHRFGTTTGSIPTTRTIAPGNGDLPISSTSNSGGWSAEGANGIGLLASGSNAAGAIVIAINTTGKADIDVSWTCTTVLQQTSRDNSIALQYRIGNSGNFIDLGDASHVYTSQGKTEGITSAQNFTFRLPATCNNNSNVQLRWIYWESNGSTGSRDRIAVGKINIQHETTLPVNFTSFIANKTGNTVSFNFSTASESNNDFFTIERSKDGNSFTSIITVPTTGTSMDKQIYTATDFSPLSGINYYRLKQTDKNSDFSYFPEIRFINIFTDLQNIIRVYPNPVIGEIKLDIPENGNNILMDLVTMDGKKVIGKQGSVIEIEDYLNQHLSSLNSGIYILKINGNKNYSTKLIKQ